MAFVKEKSKMAKFFDFIKGKKNDVVDYKQALQQAYNQGYKDGYSSADKIPKNRGGRYMAVKGYNHGLKAKRKYNKFYNN